jgi:type VI secretion system protein VasD
MKSLHLLSVLVFVSTLLGCAGPRPVMPAPYTLVITANSGINPDLENRATPVQVRLYELKNSSRFETIDFYTLFDKDEQTLSEDSLSKEQLTVQPGQRVTLVRKAKPEARMLGVFVAFKNLENSTWRAVTPLPQAKELGRWSIFNPTFQATMVTVQIGPRSVTAKTMGSEVPVTIPGSGGLPQVRVPSLPSGNIPMPSSNIPIPSGNIYMPSSVPNSPFF